MGRRGSSPLTRGAREPGVLITISQRIIPAHAGSTPPTALGGDRTPDHPRSRGEHRIDRGSIGSPFGSSPLTRGAQTIASVDWEARRIIPAHAGSTNARLAPSVPATDHPRSRGEHPTRRLRSPSNPGSSPLTRGARRCRIHQGPRRRIIPAHAGSTPTPLAWRLRVPDHPRSRGEHSPVLRSIVQRDGSSPLTRGALASAWVANQTCRIIPAHAGSTIRSFGQRQTITDHPRSRGEHDDDGEGPLVCGGSSPLTRGALWVGEITHWVLRIIPAHAGSTLASTLPMALLTDHPRSRGEHRRLRVVRRLPPGSSPLTRGAPASARLLRLSARIIPAHAGSTVWCRTVAFRAAGSSPLTRGAPYQVLTKLLQRRIIPAHAGSTTRSRTFGTGSSDHPRSRGEHAEQHCHIPRPPGSSPLTRGARDPVRDPGRKQRIIPAHAGSTMSRGANLC